MGRDGGSVVKVLGDGTGACAATCLLLGARKIGQYPLGDMTFSTSIGHPGSGAAVVRL